MELFCSLFAQYLPDFLFVRSITYIVMYAVMLFFILYTVKRSSVNFLPQIIDTMPRGIFIALIIFDFTGFYKTFGNMNTLYNILYTISTIGVLICVIFFVLKIFTLTYQQNEIIKQFNEQKNFSEKMLKGDENLRRFRHDYRNHMIVINALLESGSTDRAREYINAMNADINGTLNKISTGNLVADAIINTKAVVAAGTEIKIKFRGQFPNEGIRDVDICTILSNALDNALEAAEKTGKPETITIEAAVRQNNFILDISNPVAEDIKIGKNNTLKTTKKNRSEHGIGTKNIQRVVNKHNGMLELSCENKVFTFSLMLKLEKKENEAE